MYTCLRSITTVRTAIGQGYRWRNIDARKRVHASLRKEYPVEKSASN